MYKGAVISVRKARRDIDEFPITMDLSPHLFTLVMDELIIYIQDDIHWRALFVDDIILVDKTSEGIN